MLLKLLLDTTKQGEIPWSQVKLLKGLAQMVFMGYNRGSGYARNLPQYGRSLGLNSRKKILR
jgi:hypothetical protein